MKKSICLISLSILLLLTVTVNAISHTDTTPYSWYCMRVEGNVQPTIEDKMKFTENYGGYFLDKKCNNNKVIYLTFDAGYENGNIEKILDILKQQQVIGAFFILENLINRNPDLVKRMESEGHTICNHTMKHKDMTKIKNIDDFKAELDGLSAMYKECTGKDMALYYRPPEGKFSESNLRFAQELGYKTIFWSFAYADWDNNDQPSPENSKSKILRYTHNGEVILLHPTSATNAAILNDLIIEWKNQGYTFGTLDGLTKDEI